jgi:hypothetical protein
VPTRRARAKRRLYGAPWLPIASYLGVVACLSLASGGVAPPAMTHALPAWLVLMWTVALAAGGLLSTIGVLSEKTRVESAGLVLLTYGAGLYGLVLSVALWPNSLGIILVAVAICGMCGIRLRVLALARHAQKVATEQRRDGDGG